MLTAPGAQTLRLQAAGAYAEARGRSRRRPSRAERRPQNASKLTVSAPPAHGCRRRRGPLHLRGPGRSPTQLAPRGRPGIGRCRLARCPAAPIGRRRRATFASVEGSASPSTPCPGPADSRTALTLASSAVGGAYYARIGRRRSGGSGYYYWLEVIASFLRTGRPGIGQAPAPRPRMPPRCRMRRHSTPRAATATARARWAARLCRGE
jgi:hypothetical protein